MVFACKSKAMNPIETFFSLITCIFNNMAWNFFYCFYTLFCQFNIGDICTSTHFVGFVFLLNLDFCFWNPFIFNSVSIYDFYDVTEVLRIKECSPIPLSYLLNAIHLPLLQICQLNMG